MAWNSKSNRFTVFLCLKVNTPYRKSVHKYKKVLDKTLHGILSEKCKDRRIFRWTRRGWDKPKRCGRN